MHDCVLIIYTLCNHEVRIDFYGSGVISTMVCLLNLSELILGRYIIKFLFYSFLPCKINRSTIVLLFMRPDNIIGQYALHGPQQYYLQACTATIDTKL